MYRISRYTHETKIELAINLDGTGESNINTGLPFFDHMLDKIARHGSIDLNIQVDGDLEVDEHHSIEEPGIALCIAIRVGIVAMFSMEGYGLLFLMNVWID